MVRVKQKRETTWYKKKKLHRITLDIPIKHWKWLKRKSKQDNTSIQKLIAAQIEQNFILSKFKGEQI